MSRRARARAAADKRAMYHSGDAPDIEAAFARLTAERKPEPEDKQITLMDGSAIDKRQPWSFPTNSEGAV